MIRNHLVIMAKLPAAGRVKTRLARDIGSAEAVRVYRTILFDTIRRLSTDPRWLTWIAAAPDTATFSPVWPSGVLVVNQGAGDLGQRMQRVFDIMPRGPVAIIGSDIPGIACSDIADAFTSLGNNDAVFGPSTDGGYWLVGQRRRPRVLQMFSDVRWSSKHTLADTVANLESYRTGLIRQIDDLDTVDDYRRWLHSLSPQGRGLGRGVGRQSATSRPCRPTPLSNSLP